MRLGIHFPQEWKAISEKDNIAMSDILYGYAMEHLMKRIEKSSFHEILWLTNEQALGEAAYRKNTKERLEYFYTESGKKRYHQSVQAGDSLNKPVVDLLAMELFGKDEKEELTWTYYIEERANCFYLVVEGHYLDMHVPITIKIEEAPKNAQSPKRKELELLFAGKKPCTYFSYSKESVLAEALFEMVRKLELISDMEVYHIANEVLKNQSVNGRHIMEDFQVLGEKEPKVVTMKRLEQLESYQTYTYMRKKWQQYEKRHGLVPEEWNQVLERILSFMRPVWNAMCNNEIFFDDWMPELGRFLG